MKCRSTPTVFKKCITTKGSKKIFLLQLERQPVRSLGTIYLHWSLRAFLNIYWRKKLLQNLKFNLLELPFFLINSVQRKKSKEWKCIHTQSPTRIFRTGILLFPEVVNLWADHIIMYSDRPYECRSILSESS